MDMGTGLNAQIIATSVFWRFEFFTGIILLTLTLPLNYFLTKSLGIVGPAIANLIAFSVYNGIRCIFLWKKMKMQPFNIKTLYTILLGVGCYCIIYLLFNKYQGLGWIMTRSIAFIVLYTAGILYFKPSPDIFHVLDSVKNRLVRKSRS